MPNIYVSFGIRLKSDKALSVIGERAGRVLGCRFTETQDPEHPDATILQAEALCLRLIISHGPCHDDPTLQMYQVNGENVIKPRWDYSEEIDLTQWMLQEFRKRDSPDWYLPTIEELKKEAGID